jgi:hypothetical protein
VSAASPDAEVDGRTRHYGGFYGLDPVPADRPLWLVHGNCQAEALRVLLATATDAGFTTVRIPPVHELTADDLPHLDALLARTQVLLSQPVREDYRDLPLGTAQLAGRLPPGARVLRWPVIRIGALHPYQVIVRHPCDRSLDPPLVAYHDLRTVVAAAAPGELGPLPPADAPAQAYRDAATASVAELARRESAQCDVRVSDALAAAGAGAAHTVNHPGNPVLTALAQRVQAALGEPVDVGDPGRDLLGGVRAPLEPAVLAALGLGTGAARATWLVGGEPVDAQHVHRVQGAFYRADPGWLDAAQARHGERMALLGLPTSPA